jgi:hypothetical protein
MPRSSQKRWARSDTRDSRTSRKERASIPPRSLSALLTPNLETRVVEALPWVVWRYPDMNWKWLSEHAKVHDAQNRLGFVLLLARELAERKEDSATAARLRELEPYLERSRLAREDTLCRDTMTQAERRWLQEHRSSDARHWNLLTDLRAENLPDAA